jgi:hypothetical protein
VGALQVRRVYGPVFLCGMGDSIIDLIVVVDPEYGGRLAMASRIAPVWAIAILDNKEAARRIRGAEPAGDHREKGAVTCYEGGGTDDRFADLISVLPALEEHHAQIAGDRFSFPRYFTLRVIGLALSDRAVEALRGLGFSSFFEIADGFEARISENCE